MVAMMQAAEFRHRYNSSAHARDFFWITTRRRSLGQRKMRPILMAVTDVFVYKTFQMPLVQNDHLIEQVAAQLPNQRSATPFCHGLLKLVRLGWIPARYLPPKTLRMALR